MHYPHMSNTTSCRLLQGLIMLLWCGSTLAQSGLEVEAHFINGFYTTDVVNWDEDVEFDYAIGYSFDALYTYGFKDSRYSLRGGLGLKQISLAGTSGNTAFTSRSSRVVITAGARYRLASKWRIGLGLTAENNLDFEHFRTATADLFRYSVHLETLYRFHKRFSAVLRYNKAFYPLVDVYLISNPTDQVSVGVNFEIW